MRYTPMILAGALSLAAQPLLAKVSPEEAAKLGKELTPIGAERAGNADGTIPEWTGGLPALDIDEPTHWEDPFPDDKVLFTITKDNVDQYKDKLTVGHLALFNAYGDTYKMNVYKTRRSSGFPEEYYGAAANKTEADMLQDAELKELKFIAYFHG